MFFEQSSIAFQILDVLCLEQENVKKYNSNRNFDALSFRYKADTVIGVNGKEIEMTDGCVAYFPSEVDYTRISKTDKMIVVHFKAFSYYSNEVECFFPADYEKYAHLFNKLLDCWIAKNVSYMHDSAAILNNIFSELYKDSNPSPHHTSKIYPSILYIEENCLQPDFSLTIAAEKSLVSDTYFRKLFKKEFNMSPKQYIINRRMRHAASLIIAGYYSLEEISELCGYNDYKHFSVEFKKIIGCSPSKYIYSFTEDRHR